MLEIYTSNKNSNVASHPDNNAQRNVENSGCMELDPTKRKDQDGNGSLGKNQKASTQAPKNENVDKEIEEMALKLIHDNQRKMDHLKSLALLNSNPQLIEKPPEDEPKSDDWTSVQGQFGWAEISNTTIPYLTRRGEKYVSLRMAENRILLKFRNMFTDEVRSCFYIQIIQATQAEARLLNEINFRHCDNFYGQQEFGVSDSLISLTDLREMFDFLSHCYLLLIERVAVAQNKCGFVKIADQNCVPYVWHDHKQYLPLFYFEGECKYLEERAVVLCGWLLAYLKLYCKIQGIRKQLFDSESITVVEMELVKKFFPPDTGFVVSWPTDCRMDTLINRPVPRLVFSQPGQIPSSESGKANDAKSKNGTNIGKNKSVPQNNAVFIAPNSKTLPKNPFQPSGINSNTFKVPEPYSTKTTTTSVNTPPTTSTSFQSPQVFWKKRTPAQNTLVRFVPIPTGFQKAFANSIAEKAQNEPYKARPMVCRTTSRVLQIGEVTSNNGYFLVKIPVENKHFQHCMNMEPFITTNLLVTLEEVAAFFEMQLPLVIKAINVMSLDIYLPNKVQKKEMEKYKVPPTKGLLKLQDFLDNLPQLKYILSKSKYLVD